RPRFRPPAPPDTIPRRSRCSAPTAESTPGHRAGVSAHPPGTPRDVPGDILYQARPSPPPSRAESATCDRGADRERGRGGGTGAGGGEGRNTGGGTNPVGGGVGGAGLRPRGGEAGGTGVRRRAPAPQPVGRNRQHEATGASPASPSGARASGPPHGG